ncbi:MAG: hypothetical protein A2017_19170 [Lentisphaerae bacterium GWF2_44_16]|nr:MAG: hypothetical protein A2017_19170 [Lentisphaerae bacterium GWF2_44_16]
MPAGKFIKNKNIQWNAKWIWEHGIQDRTFSYVCFRKKFDIEKVPPLAVLYITANNNYHAFLNGKRIGTGPAFSQSRFKRFESYNTGALLKEGVNCLSVIVHHYDENDSVNPEYKGLLCQIDIHGKTVCVSDSTWKTFSCRAYHQEPRVKMGYTFWPEFFDARSYPHGWTECDFNDDLWQSAVPVKKAFDEFWQCEQSQARVFPWINLISSELEPLKYTRRIPVEIITEGEVIEKMQPSSHDTAIRMSIEQILPLEKASIQNSKALLNNTAPVVVCGSDLREKTETFDGIRDATLILDFGRIINARLGFRISSQSGAMIDIGYSNRLEGKRIVPYVSCQTPMADQYTASEGEQTWQGFHWRQFRYIQLTFRNSSGGIKIHELWAEQVEYPFILKGGFECNDSLLNCAVNAARFSTELNVVDHTMDNATRERRYHVGDCTAHLWSIWSFFGNCGIVERYLRHAEETRQICGGYERAAGLRGVVIDSDWEFPSVIYEHYMLYGNKELLEEMWPGLELLARFIESCIEKDGTIISVPYLQYYDWADVRRNKHNFLLNAYAAHALQNICMIFRELNIDKSLNRRLEIVEVLRQALREKWYDSSRGVFLDNPYDAGEENHISEHSNSYAIYSGIASHEQIVSICNMYEKHPGIFAEANAGWKCFPLALLKAGRVDLFIRWAYSHFGKWFDSGIDTVAECWSMYGETTPGHWRTRNSRAQAQAAGVVGLPFALLTELCGIQVLEPGCRIMRFAPNPGGLKSFKGILPIKDGACSLTYRRDGKKQHIDIKVPDIVNSIVIDLPSYSSNDLITIHGKKTEHDEMHLMPYGQQVHRLRISGKKSLAIVLTDNK